MQTAVYDYFRNALDVVGVALTEQGICAIALADNEKQVLIELQRLCPYLELKRDVKKTKKALKDVQRFLLEQVYSDLPLDIQGTDFQKQVWQALIDIPAGETRSYKQIAEQLGRPKASRAVANACGANKISLLIPCHRAVHSNGSIAGFGWGERRKEILLANEAGSILS